MLKRGLWIVVGMGLVVPAFGRTFLCTNRNSFEGQVQFQLQARSGKVTYGKNSCSLKPIKYNPVSSKYEGWIRQGATHSTDAGCIKVATRLFGSGREPILFYWVSISKELQAGKDGFAQFGYQNIWDPGSGGEAKTFVRCRATQN
jgi:hypothetical protein